MGSLSLAPSSIAYISSTQQISSPKQSGVIVNPPISARSRERPQYSTINGCREGWGSRRK